MTFRRGLSVMMITQMMATMLVAATPRVVEVTDVAPTWAGHPVGYALLTHGQMQYIGFYDADRQWTMAQRSLDSDQWTFHILPFPIGWDSHNYITMTLDDAGHLHVSGNMHNHPLRYFRTTMPGDIKTLRQIPSMVGELEQRVTYPRFMRGPDGELIFTYRHGGSGNGIQIYNVYDQATQTWSRLLDQPLVDGQGEMNAYLHGPVKGPDGWYHLVWVWRDTPDCATNHTLSYARSRDLRSWETSAGKSLELPMTIETAEVIDPVPVNGGMLNGNTVIGFDHEQRVVVAYHKFDENGNTQLYNARREEDGWKIYQTSDWNYRWEFSGGGTIGALIRLGGVKPRADGTLSQSFKHPTEGSGLLKLDAQTLKAIGTIEEKPSRPPQLEKVEGEFPGLQVRWQNDSGRSGEKGVSYLLRWETLPANRDRPHPEPWPGPSMLRVYKIAAE